MSDAGTLPVALLSWLVRSVGGLKKASSDIEAQRLARLGSAIFSSGDWCAEAGPAMRRRLTK
jgi:hypothetical protein